MKSESESKLFSIIRKDDFSGVSGTGKVLDGVVFPNGKTVVSWRSIGQPSSIAVYECFRDFKRIHIDSHPGNGTEIIWQKEEKKSLLARFKKK